MIFFLIFTLVSFSFSFGRDWPWDSDLKLKVIEDAPTRNALCNDGSCGIYYLRTNTKSDNWVIFLQGGGGCYSLESCQERYKNDKNMMTAANQPLKMKGNGILSDNCTENPAFCNDNVVHVHYCSSDWWSGSNSLSPQYPFYFFGSYIVKYAIVDLLNLHGLNKAKRVVLTGSSAGGVGTLSNSDAVGALLRETVPDVDYSIIADSGWFLDGTTLKPWPCVNNEQCAYEHRISHGQAMWGFVPHEKCGQSYNQTDMWKCMVGYHLYPFIESRKMVLFYVYDLWQAWQDGVDGKSKISQMTDTEKAWVSNRGNFVMKSVADLEIAKNGGMWVQGCYWHGTVGDNNLYMNSKTFDGIAPNDAIVEFMAGKNPNHADLNCTSIECNADCPGAK